MHLARAIPGICIALLALLTTPALGAQLVYTLDAGGSATSYDGGPGASGVAISPTLRLELPRSSLVASGGLSFFDGGAWAAQGLLSASAFSRVVRGFRGELSGTANGIAYARGRHSAYLVSQGRLHLAGSSAGAWVGIGGGQTVSQSSVSGLALTDVGAWWRGSEVMLTAYIARSEFRSHDAWQASSSTAPDAPFTGLLTYRRRVLQDAVAALHWEHGPIDLDAGIGARIRTRSDAAHQWGSLGATFWMTRSLAVVATGGTYPESFIQGFPSTRYATLGLRIASTERGRADVSILPARGEAPPTAPAGRLMLLRDGGTERTIQIIAPGATRVEIMADFTGWDPVPLDAVAPDVWRLPTRVPPGTYRVSVRVDAGPWAAPPGIPTRRDEFGTAAGVVVVY